MTKQKAIYTRKGDDGSTELGDGSVVRKDDLRVHAYGSIDELIAFLGLVNSHLNNNGKLFAIKKAITRIQHELSNLTSYLALAPTPEMITVQSIEQLEQEIDHMAHKLPPLTSFLIPAGNAITTHLHVARTVCRRAERLIVGLAQKVALNKDIFAYINRLSDWLFIAARFAEIEG